jgi:hypothetical protein
MGARKKIITLPPISPIIPGHYQSFLDTMHHSLPRPLYVSEILPVAHGETDERRGAQLMADDMSRMIRLYPPQWAWNCRRWKS